jgi:predicted NBD/HSP70 family sugar kinase
MAKISDWNSTLELFKNEVTHRNIDFFVVLGDLTEDGSNQELGQIKSDLNQVGIPYYATIGNHDLFQSAPAGGWESWKTIFGAAKGRKNVVGIIIGTGVGGGIVIDGKVINGLHGIGGEWGHNPMNAETAPCYCGHKGCVENVFSGPALERFYLEHSGKAARLPEIVKRAADGDAIAGATLDRLVTKFGEAIAVIINILDPDAVVIGGGVGNIDLLYTPRARAEVLSHLFNHEVRTEFLKPTLGDSAGVFGAASLTL